MKIPTHIAFDAYFMMWWIDEGMPTENLSYQEYCTLILTHRAYKAARDRYTGDAEK